MHVHMFCEPVYVFRQCVGPFSQGVRVFRKCVHGFRAGVSRGRQRGVRSPPVP